MTELDEVWRKMLADAGVNAARLGRREVAAYFELKAANDAIRTAGVRWLFDTLIELAAEVSRRHPQLTIEREEPHTFPVGNSTMVGTLVRVRLGLRCLEAEAGWARTPTDGIMVNGALAAARFRHFGLPREDAAMRLVRAEPLPVWIDDAGAAITPEEVAAHLDTLVRI